MTAAASTAGYLDRLARAADALLDPGYPLARRDASASGGTGRDRQRAGSAPATAATRVTAIR